MGPPYETRAFTYMKRTTHDLPFAPAKPVSAQPLFLNRVWEVRAADDYRVQWKMGMPGNHQTVVRTLSGRGEIVVEGMGRLLCPGPSVVVLDPARIRSYRTLAEPWIFWWMECHPVPERLLPMNRVLPVARLAEEPGVLTRLSRLLARDGLGAEAASAALGHLLHAWREAAAEGEVGLRSGPVARAVERMRETWTRPLPIEDLALSTGLSAGRFRKVFREVMGVAPKRYEEGLRMEAAVSMLRDPAMKLAEIAGKLGYSSEFHFSAAFKKWHGATPSRYRAYGERP